MAHREFPASKADARDSFISIKRVRHFWKTPAMRNPRTDHIGGTRPHYEADKQTCAAAN
jgi:hypothetical protein